MQKQQNSLIAGLRATNEIPVKQEVNPIVADTAIDVSGTTNGSIEKKDTSNECFDPLQADYMKETAASTSIVAGITTTSTTSTLGQVSAAEQLRLRKKSQNILNRSDSTGSTSGRKFLAPTLSDPQAIRSDKYSQKKKGGNFISTSGTNNANISAPTGQIAQPNSRTQMLTSSSNTGLSAVITTPSTSNIVTSANTTAKHILPQSVNDASLLHSTSQLHHNNIPLHHHHHHHLHHHHHHHLNSAQQSMQGFEAQQNAGSTANAPNNRTVNNINSNQIGPGSSSTGSNSKVNSTVAGANNSHTNVVFEVHDWWSDQVIVQQSSDDDNE